MLSFIVPANNLNSDTLMISGNFIARKATGYHNGNRTSWHVYHVEWIIGAFEPHSNAEVDLGHSLATRFDYESTIVTSFDNMCFITVKKLGQMSKHEAKALIKQKYEDLNHTVAWGASSDNEFMKHVTN